eukprot:4725893-Prymnesium_polylepis.1
MVPKSSRCSKHERCEKLWSCCGQMPIRSRIERIAPRMERPRMETWPDDGGKSPVRMPIVVDLPAPFCPSSAVSCRSCKSSVTPVSASTRAPPSPTNVFVTLCSRTATPASAR